MKLKLMTRLTLLISLLLNSVCVAQVIEFFDTVEFSPGIYSFPDSLRIQGERVIQSAGSIKFEITSSNTPDELTDSTYVLSMMGPFSDEFIALRFFHVRDGKPLTLRFIEHSNIGLLTYLSPAIVYSLVNLDLNLHCDRKNCYDFDGHSLRVFNKQMRELRNISLNTSERSYSRDVLDLDVYRKRYIVITSNVSDSENPKFTRGNVRIVDLRNYEVVQEIQFHDPVRYVLLLNDQIYFSYVNDLDTAMTLIYRFNKMK